MVLQVEGPDIRGDIGPGNQEGLGLCGKAFGVYRLEEGMALGM